MFLSTHFVSTALVVLSTVNASPPQGRDNSANVRMVRAPTCPLGQYLDYTTYPGYTICTICPAGKTCDGNGAADCDTGHAQPYNGTSGVCPECRPGTYQNKRGATFCVPCPGGEYAPYNATINCNKAPSGWFQGFPGKPFKCGTCCGWEALANGNIVPSNCTTSGKPNAYKNSGSGCTAEKTDCVHALTCAQNPITGACPPGSETSYQI